LSFIDENTQSDFCYLSLVVQALQIVISERSASSDWISIDSLHFYRMCSIDKLHRVKK
jgi:hypothetical protein